MIRLLSLLMIVGAIAMPVATLVAFQQPTGAAVVVVA
jgi:hypothetical protein